MLSKDYNGEFRYSKTLSTVNFSEEMFEIRPRSVSRDLQREGGSPLGNEFCKGHPIFMKLGT